MIAFVTTNGEESFYSFVKATVQLWAVLLAQDSYITVTIAGLSPVQCNWGTWVTPQNLKTTNICNDQSSHASKS